MKNSKPDSQFYQLLEAFPPSVHENLQTILQTGGMLAPEQCVVVMTILKISDEVLMQRLLPMAKMYSKTTISNFQVGAVAKARLSDNASESALFLGANIEFPAQALTQTIHAEQAAIINAWLQGQHKSTPLLLPPHPVGTADSFFTSLKGVKT